MPIALSRNVRGRGRLTAAAGCLLALTAASAPEATIGQVVPYNPYADSQDPIPPVLPDGTIHWGTFYKSASIQKAYERLWNLGACRNTNKAITIPVENNRLAIDSLPEGEYRGVVHAVTGTNSGGAIAFLQASADGGPATERVALLHPAGVSRVDVTGTAPVSILTPGMAVRFQATVDAKGRVAAPVRVFHVIAPATDAKPTPITAGTEEMIVGRVVQAKRGTLTVRVDAGKIRRVTVTVATDAAVEVATAQVTLAGPGDTIEVKGRLWTGEGALGEGTIFADRITVVKAAGTTEGRRDAEAGVGTR